MTSQSICQFKIAVSFLLCTTVLILLEKRLCICKEVFFSFEDYSLHLYFTYLHCW